MSKVLVAYFSATGTTKDLAEKIADLGAFDLVEIKPSKAYSSADLNWQDAHSRTSLERDNALPVELAASSQNIKMDQYDKILLGFPIWWYQAPKIINAFLESYDLKGKEISLFASSGGSDFGHTLEMLQPSAEGARLRQGIINQYTEDALKKYIERI
ncbi:flavodoxin [Peptococcus simiae]|uniref:Flavodoxin n=1 Tax=Peptococcus simiae TaxID=1643805 RepID=A0ABW9GZE3_9FIRM